MMINTKAFTLVEIIVTAIIVALLGMMAIPSMLLMMNRSYASDARSNLMAMYAGQQNYNQNNGGVYATCASNTLCNTALGLNIISSGGMTYACAANICTATHSAFTMNISLRDPVLVTQSLRYGGGAPNYTLYNPCCTGGTAGNICP